eukprot:scaffold1732_cov34-Tisochrysis_lutea.AAC.1
MLPQAVFSTKTFYAKSYPGTVALGKCCAAWVLWRAWCCHHMRAQTFDQAMVAVSHHCTATSYARPPAQLNRLHRIQLDNR